LQRRSGHSFCCFRSHQVVGSTTVIIFLCWLQIKLSRSFHTKCQMAVVWKLIVRFETKWISGWKHGWMDGQNR
jgi:hypothetical protein